MNTKKVVAALVGTALVATTAMSFAGCKEKKAELNISDYAIEYTESNKPNEGYTKLNKLYSYNESGTEGTFRVETSSTGYVVLRNTVKNGESNYNSTYSVYNTKYEKSVVSNLKENPDINNDNLKQIKLSLDPDVDPDAPGANTISEYLLQVANKVEIKDENDIITSSYSTYSLYSPNGDALISGLNYTPNISKIQYYYVSGELTPVLTVSGMPRPTGTETPKPSVRYWAIELDEDTHAFKFTSVNATSIKNYGPEYNVGEYQTGVSEKLYELFDIDLDDLEELYGEAPAAELADYSAAYMGNTMTLYKNNEKTGSIDLTNAEVVGLVGKYLYYSVELPVDSNEKSNYNYSEVKDDGLQVRYNYTLYKYDVLKNKTSEVKYDGKVEYVMPLYNHTNKNFDAAVIVGYKNIDGVAHKGYSTFYYLTNSELTMAYDVTDLAAESSVSAIYKLNDTSYKVGRFIVDGDLNILSKIEYSETLTADMLVSFTVGGHYGFKDLNGKIVFEPKYKNATGYGAPVFYSGSTVAQELQADGTYEYVMLKTDGTSNAYVKNDNKSEVYKDGWFIVTTTKDETVGNITTKVPSEYKICNFEDTAIATYTNTDSKTYNVVAEGSLLKVTETVKNADNTTTSTVTLYKVA